MFVLARRTVEMIEELRRFARGEGFNEQPMPGLESEALDFRAASESFVGVRWLARRDLPRLWTSDRFGTHHKDCGLPPC